MEETNAPEGYLSWPGLGKVTVSMEGVITVDSELRTGMILYIVLIMFFGYFYTMLQMNPEEMSKNLNKSGGYIPGIRPGTDTSNYLAKVINRLSFVGSILLVIIAILPILFSKFSGLSSAVTIGGTGLLIVVGVAIETNKQLDSSLISRSYKKGYRRR